jgi:TonB family protein
MIAISNTLARTTICAVAALAAATLVLTTAVTTVQAAEPQDWTGAVNARIDHVMRSLSTAQKGAVHVKFTVAPDGSVSDAAVVGGNKNLELRREALRTAKALGTLPAIEGAKAPVRVSMILQFGGSASDLKKFTAPAIQFATNHR